MCKYLFIYTCMLYIWEEDEKGSDMFFGIRKMFQFPESWFDSVMKNTRKLIMPSSGADQKMYVVSMAAAKMNAIHTVKERERE